MAGASARRGGGNVEIDLAIGLTARVGDVGLEMADVLDRRPFTEADVTLGGIHYGLSNVYTPGGSARLSIGGVVVPGTPVVDRAAAEPSSSAFLAVAEVWTR